ncbi:MAG TPA: hypothetical protein VHY08_16335 [Bacillota bacterium]|nr:hypothetical protein [Bacillota bacterium]
MANETEKKGLLGKLFGNKKEKKDSCCCCNFEVEEVPEGENANPDGKTPKDKKGGSCCG